MSNQKLTLVTGATRGLGYAMALDAARRGSHVVALGRNQGSLDELADAVDETPGSITMVPMDITDDNAIAYLGKSIFERWGRLDYWLHTAWFTPSMQPVPQMIAKDLDKAWQVNVRATARLIVMLDPILRQTKNAQAVFFDDPINHGPLLSGQGASKSAQIEIVQNWKEAARRIGPKVEIATPAPFQGAMRATLYPGEDRSALSTATREAEKILDMVMVI